MNEQNVSVVILAAGKGTRMKSAQAKVMHEVFFKPMIHHVLDALTPLHIHQTVVVTGHQAEKVEHACSGYDVSFVRQLEQLGTGHAVLAAESALLSVATDVVMILCGDTPLIRPETLQSMLNEHLTGSHKLTVMTTVVDEPTNYGRIILSNSGYVQAIVEEKDASPQQKKINEINAGIYCVEKHFLFTALQGVGTDNKQGEVYLTDIIAIAHSSGLQVQRFFCQQSEETLGVNSRYELSLAHATLQRRFLRKLMDQGVTCVLPETITISGEVEIGRDTIISPNVAISGKTKIGENCRVAPFSCLVDSQLGDNVSIGEFSYLNGITVADNDSILPQSCMNHKMVSNERGSLK
ncbi:MAG: NTP transferase domain-containing protein [Proteobacteria bacterium]|nr:NTP transferase domain-containing protein [Pseudomonadota bacterium]